MYTIGEIARLTDISIKTLRFYDQIGIVQPEIRNPQTGYRYYAEKQIMQLQVLKELKPFGFSLEDIRNIIEKQDIGFTQQKMAARIETMETEIHKLEQQLAAIKFAYNRFLEGSGALSGQQTDTPPAAAHDYQVELCTVPETWVLYTRYRSYLSAERLFLERCLELHKLRDKYNLFQSGGFIGIFHDGYASQFIKKEGDLELCLPVIKPEGFNCPELKLLESFPSASIIHVGHYRDSLRAYLILLEWIETNDYEINGPPVEHYILDVGNAYEANHYVTRIYFPVVKK